VAEFERTVKKLGFVGALINGSTEGRFLDHPSYAPLLSAAVALDVPIYVHPHLAPEAVRNHPTDEHLLPFHVALGAAHGRAARRLHSGTTYGLLAMDSYGWGLPAAAGDLPIAVEPT